MEKYPKIKTVYKRDPETNNKRLLIGQYADPIFEYLADNKWVFTEKVDGTNIRVMLSDHVQESNGERIMPYRITFGGRTDAAQIPAPLIARLEELFHTVEQQAKLAQVFPDGNVCLYGEGYGAKIQKAGKNYRFDQDFVLFDVKVEDHWIERSNVEDVAERLGLDVVPLIGTGTLPEMIDRVRIGFASAWSLDSSFIAEGIVARPACELCTRNGNRIITKIKHRDFN